MTFSPNFPYASLFWAHINGDHLALSPLNPLVWSTSCVLHTWNCLHRLPDVLQEKHSPLRVSNCNELLGNTSFTMWGPSYTTSNLPRKSIFRAFCIITIIPGFEGSLLVSLIKYDIPPPLNGLNVLSRHATSLVQLFQIRQSIP